MNYKIHAGLTTTVENTENGRCFQVDNPYSQDWREFLIWNASQAEPLNWQTPETETSLPVPSTEERIAAMEDTILAMLLGG